MVGSKHAVSNARKKQNRTVISIIKMSPKLRGRTEVEHRKGEESLDTRKRYPTWDVNLVVMRWDEIRTLVMGMVTLP
jgi:hypothetical protein